MEWEDSIVVNRFRNKWQYTELTDNLTQGKLGPKAEHADVGNNHASRGEIQMASEIAVLNTLNLLEGHGWVIMTGI